MEQDQAAALQRELYARNFPTEVVDQSQLPVLNEPATGMGFEIGSDALVVDSATTYPWDMLSFAAAGYVVRLTSRPYLNRWEVVLDPFATRTSPVQHAVEFKMERIPEFHIEFFFSMKPYRLQWVWQGEATVRVNQDPVGLGESETFVSILQQLTNLLPAERLNSGIRRLVADDYFVYPSVHAFEKEIVWTFYQLMRNEA